ncbi:MAG: Ktr system potassium transporter B [Rhodobacteraceae bacterium]|jgi:trk system potassium uptake protein TrkH|uniref:Trk system potassium uptake protein TrkH n=1 Tax=Salipiger profundus TaxID=1229727 RepID=A0A1U7DA31_9RHOB|nr:MULTISPECIES: potassium transporter TrkG [Salipiger]APX25021.1 trk system potassium uptake protein TrkH [Salipiger profundus]MAB07529.1 Ktr system potassium transporter B [Paracoccaceae bacterium]GGA14881.1 Ktr system potassium transporter B [Salipiger profundus]SFD12717.1 trk system potassium uptake protein TrkH [Salipiger profundus]
MTLGLGSISAHRLLRRLLHISPPLSLAGLYAGFILLGGLCFKLPGAMLGELSWSDAFFTAASAVTVTGLSVVDAGTQFNLLGEAVLLVLIQLGGLGLMTFAVLVLAALKVPVGLTGQIYLSEELNQSSMHRLMRLVKRIFQVVLVCELAGAALLATSFVPMLGLGRGLWVSLFHAVSAFNNAGFSTFSDGLVPLAADPIINIVIPALFIVGGVGYVVIDDVIRNRRWGRFSLHTKIMLSGSTILIFWGWGAFAALEWHNPGTLGQFDGAPLRLMVAWFQGVTPRTAGFNTVEMAEMHDSTALMVISLMLIGAGPTSTAGGIKVTTFVVMCLATVAFFQRRTQLNAFGRSIGLHEVLKVMALTAISVIVVFVGVFLLAATQEGHFLDVSFEVASAFGTVGLSRGFTGELTDPGRAVIVAIMFIGRVGPLTLGYFLATRSVPRVRYPEGRIHLG